MGDVFDRWRLNQGWNPWDNETQMAAIASWVHSLDRESVPFKCYSELYERSLATRARCLQSGKHIPQFGVELMLAEWPQLRDEIKQRDIDSGRMLTGHAESQCPRCLGTGGREMKFDENGHVLGVTAKLCDHRPAEDGEVLFKADATGEDVSITEADVAVKAVQAAWRQNRYIEPPERIIARLAREIHIQSQDNELTFDEREELLTAWSKMLRVAQLVRSNLWEG